MDRIFWWLNEHHEVRFLIGVVLPSLASALMTSPSSWYEVAAGMIMIILCAIFALTWICWLGRQ